MVLAHLRLIFEDVALEPTIFVILKDSPTSDIQKSITLLFPASFRPLQKKETLMRWGGCLSVLNFQPDMNAARLLRLL